MNEPGRDEVKDSLYRKATKRRFPLAGTAELSPICNMNCRMCYVRRTRSEVDLLGGLIGPETWKKLLDEAYDAGMLFLLITGGEPLVYDGFWDIYEHFSSKGIVITVNTNATLIDEKAADRFLKNPPAKLNITLYGTSNDTYERLCGNPHGFDQVMNAVKLLRDRNIPCKFNSSVTPENYYELPEMYRIAESFGIALQAATYMFPPIRRDPSAVGKNARLDPVTAGKCKVFTDRMVLSNEDFVRVASGSDALANPVDSCEFVPQFTEGEKMRCRAGRSSFWISWQGIMTSCGMLDFPQTFPLTEGFSPCWKKICDYTDGVRLSSECAACPQKRLCNPCLAMSRCETGKSDGKPEYMCVMTDAMITEYRVWLNSGKGTLFNPD
ncbi:MAG: radical SAM protein [Oscillospiraceae bacterium]|nr:radical SAM protein [Oscillospiraceae bacterium]